MGISNLKINILYFMCDPANWQGERGTVTSGDVFKEFSDIAQGEIMNHIHEMLEDGHLSADSSRSRISITERGILRLQSSLACRLHDFDHCRCKDEP